MNPIFEKRVEELEKTFKIILDSSPVDQSTLPTKGGVYVFSEGSKHLYVGRRETYEEGSPVTLLHRLKTLHLLFV
jgi:hypothetical protein